MNPQVELNLALILFIPWFSILAWLFWAYPRQPRGGARSAFDAASLILATLAAGWGMHWGFYNADPQAGAIWKQVLATSVAYGLFLAVMTAALILRWRWLRRRAATAASFSSRPLAGKAEP
ncbi:hypothetical protein [Lysobacter antibioticus]|uniref:hypothetical protein n=1 Tax=Lysobacter antibioticus TaxID=84531 RepID=UPI000345BEE4|nr:hypothetical protein [Lysobacter antibioticus]